VPHKKATFRGSSPEKTIDIHGYGQMYLTSRAPEEIIVCGGHGHFNIYIAFFDKFM
jgi:hypothetical protein